MHTWNPIKLSITFLERILVLGLYIYTQVSTLALVNLKEIYMFSEVSLLLEQLAFIFECMFNTHLSCWLESCYNCQLYHAFSFQPLDLQTYDVKNQKHKATHHQEAS
jgi:hypothetical protein